MFPIIIEISPNLQSLFFYLISSLTVYANRINGARGRLGPSIGTVLCVKVVTGLFTLVPATSRTIYKSENYIIKPYS